MDLSRIADPQRTLLLRADSFLQHPDECVVSPRRRNQSASEAGLHIPDVLEEPLIRSGFFQSSAKGESRSSCGVRGAEILRKDPDQFLLLA